MKITAVTATVLRLPEVTAACDGTQDTCIIQIETDAGITGIGEVDSAPTVIKAIIDAPLSHQVCNGIANALVGENPLDRESCIGSIDQALNYYGRTGAGAHAASGIDLALWDIAGKVSGKPVFELLGVPVKSRFRAYCSLLFGDTPEETEERARRYAGMGFTAIKFGWGPMGDSEENDVALVQAARRGAGGQVDILIDAGQVWDWRTALERARRFEEFGLFWLEEPLHPQDIEGYARLTEASPIPIAAGEAEALPSEFHRLIVDGGLNWVQPDPGRCGITTFAEVGRIAAENGCKVVNHSFKSGITIAASLHALSACQGTEMFEFCMSDSPLRHHLTNESFEVIDGMVSLPRGPGLGVTLNQDTINRYRLA
jgi:L-alanine-DL-glutamate epimerase-like enolase superfamily enzyme